MIDDFQDIILKNFEVEEKDMKVNEFILQFNLDGIDFDLLPATNMAAVAYRSDTVQAQSEQMFAKIRQARDPHQAAYVSSSGLTEAAVEFIKQQSQFAHKVARLTKFWNASIVYTGKKISGRSSIMELLGIAAAKQVEKDNPRKPSILEAFKCFLKKVENISTQRVAFFEMFYQKSDVPPRIWNQTPLLLDPTNPWNNFMKGFSPEAQSFFSRCAQNSLELLQKVEMQYSRSHGYPALIQVFRPQPVMRNQVSGVPKPTENIISVRHSNKMQPILLMRRCSPEQEKFSEAFQKSMSAFIHMANLQSKRSTAGTDVKQLVQDTIDDTFHGSKRSWGPSFSKHEDCDVTFEIPVANGQSFLISSNYN